MLSVPSYKADWEKKTILWRKRIPYGWKPVYHKQKAKKGGIDLKEIERVIKPEFIISQVHSWKIKDIRQFRTCIKNEIREIDSVNRNEHFVGVRTENDGKKSIWLLNMYHGDKEGFNERWN
jgi:hypothetical protein